MALWQREGVGNTVGMIVAIVGAFVTNTTTVGTGVNNSCAIGALALVFSPFFSFFVCQIRSTNAFWYRDMVGDEVGVVGAKVGVYVYGISTFGDFGVGTFSKSAART